MVSLTVGCRLFIQFRSSFNFWETWADIPKISSRYHNPRKVLDSMFCKSLFPNLFIKKLEHGEANLVPVAKPLFDGTLTTHSENNYSSK